MPALDLTARIDAPVDLVYGVVADVERYPEFLPDVARVDRRGDLVSMVLRLGPLPVTLVSRARFSPPEAIDLEQVEGPFRRFTARWTFAREDRGTRVAYRAEYELPLFGLLLGGAAGHLLERGAQSQIRAFEARVLGLLERPAASA